MNKSNVVLSVFVLAMIAEFSFASPIDRSTSEDPVQILQNLYSTYGDKRISCPELEVVNTEDFVAKYSPGSHKIVLEEKTLSICSGFGEYESDALAFIIGHELAHAFQEHLEKTDETSFLAYNKVYSSATRKRIDVKLKESEADVFGCFGAYLAGYEIHKVFPDLINVIYEKYGLSDKMLPQYPTKKSRNKSAKFMMTKLDSLVNLYDLANYLSLTGHYTEASACYKYVDKSYKGKELVNNQGVNNLLEALNMSKLDFESFYYPIEVDLNSRLHKAKKTADTKDLNPSERMLFNLLLVDAIQAFKESIAMDQSYLPAYINMICAYAIKNDSEGALDYIKNENLDQKIYNQPNPDIRASYEIAKAICLLKSGKATEGKKLLKALQSTSNENISFLAEVNLNGAPQSNAGDFSDSSDSSFKLLAKYIRTKPIKLASLTLDKKKKTEVSYWNSNDAVVYEVNGIEQLYIVVSANIIETNGTPTLVNRDYSVYKNNNISYITFESKKDQVIVISKGPNL